MSVLHVPLIPLADVLQKSGGFLDALPTAILYIIQEFLSSNDYRNLMNVNLSGYQSIKSETMRYAFLGVEKWKKLGIKEQDIVRILKSVKNKSLQISMRFDKDKQNTVVRCAHLFDGIHKLMIEEQYHFFHEFLKPSFKNGFPFGLFNNICHLKLAHIKGMH
jgi:hypothetical protein